MPYTEKMVLRLSLWGCRNRPFFLVVAARKSERRKAKFVDQIGSYDPLVNVHGEKLISLKFNRVRHWLAYGAEATGGVHDVLALAGFGPPREKMTIKAPYVLEFLKQVQASEVAAEQAYRTGVLDKGLDPDELKILLLKQISHTSPQYLQRQAIVKKLVDAGFEEEELMPPDPGYWDGTEPEFREMVHPRVGTVFEEGRRMGVNLTPKW